MVNSHAKGSKFSLMASIPNVHVSPSKGSRMMDALSNDLQLESLHGWFKWLPLLRVPTTKTQTAAQCTFKHTHTHTHTQMDQTKSAWRSVLSSDFPSSCSGYAWLCTGLVGQQHKLWRWSVVKPYTALKNGLISKSYCLLTAIIASMGATKAQIVPFSGDSQHL